MAENDIPEMNLGKKYAGEAVKESANAQTPNPEQFKKEIEKTKKQLEKLKNFIIKKFPYVKAISILPPQAIKFFIEEEDAPKESEKHTHLHLIVPDEKEKEIPKIKSEIIKELEKNKEQKIWLHIRTPSALWEICLDQKFELNSAIAMSFPLYDKGILGALRVAEIHKSLVLQKFEKYVVSYVIAGSLVRGEAIKTSDVDVFVIINDTDVKRMPRLELKERLRGIIYKYVAEASALAGVENKLEPQIYLLTDFWEAVKDAHPVMFTFIRDGVPLYDRGTFMPWKTLLQMGRLKPSPEAIDMFMSMGDNTTKRAERTLLEIVIGEIYWGVITPSQALLMLYGLPPPTPKQVVSEMKNIFVDKEKMLEKKYLDILEEIVIKYYKGYEHGKIKKVSGKEVDKLLADMEDYIKRMKELREQIEKRTSEKTIEQIYKDVFELLKQTTRKNSQKEIIKSFEKDFVKAGKFTYQHLRILNDIFKARTDFKKGKLDSHKVDSARKNASILINDLIEYSQRCELVSLEKGKMLVKYKDKGTERTSELLNCEDVSFLFKDNKVKKLTDKIEDCDMDEVAKAIEKQKGKKEVHIAPRVFELLKKEIGEFEIVL